MSTTNTSPIESAGPPEAAKPKWRSRLRRHPVLVGAAAIAGLALVIAGWGAIGASAQSDVPAPADDGDNTSYEECVAAALAAFGPPEEASSAGSDDTGTTPQAPDIEEPHPNSPAHEWCTADCPEDEQCARPKEFIVVRDEDVETVSFENPDPEGDPVSEIPKPKEAPAF
ncbi:hypothetical protein [Candidatus Poriferisocius sp.]|uniref:hypothetical protein n=1 Tax=Candidatus Poriferisocius sp. TaxID=3101276 RepID=UPI003B015F2E